MIYWERSRLQRVGQNRQLPPGAQPLGTSLDGFLRRNVYPRQKKVMELARAWHDLVPAELSEHSCVEDFRGGQMRILVDSSSYIYELHLMVQEGLLDQMRQRCPRLPLAEIKLLSGSWYRKTDDGQKIPQYSTEKRSTRKR